LHNKRICKSCKPKLLQEHKKRKGKNIYISVKTEKVSRALNFKYGKEDLSIETKQEIKQINCVINIMNNHDFFLLKTELILNHKCITKIKPTANKQTFFHKRVIPCIVFRKIYHVFLNLNRAVTFSSIRMLYSSAQTRNKKIHRITRL
jgi:hypothetical protein